MRNILAEISKKVSKVASTRRDELLASLNPDENQILEGVISAILSRMADVGLSIVLLTNRKTTHYHPFVATALCRQITEGYLYLQYILTKDSAWRAKEFMFQDLLWKESFRERNKGQDWHRRFDPKSLKNHTAGIFDKELKEGGAKNIITECDDFQKEWLLHSILHINSLLEENERLKYVEIHSLPLPEIQKKWENWGRKLKNQAKKKWELLTKRWDCMDRWPFGLSPSRIMPDIGLETLRPEEESLPGMTQSEIQAFLEAREEIGKNIKWVGWEFFSNYTHFSPAILDPSLSKDLLTSFLGNVLVYLFIAFEKVDSQFHWGQEKMITKWRNQIKRIWAHQTEM